MDLPSTTRFIDYIINNIVSESNIKTTDQNKKKLKTAVFKIYQKHQVSHPFKTDERVLEDIMKNNVNLNVIEKLYLIYFKIPKMRNLLKRNNLPPDTDPVKLPK